MCKDCGCEQAHVQHHNHPHTHEHTHLQGRKEIQVNSPILARNNEAAARNREWLAARGVVTVNLISSPGSGKTALLEATLDALRDLLACAVLTGDQQTDNDARRLADRGAHVHQIETHDACHLNAEQIERVLPHVVTEGTRILFLENVGNLVCPAAFDLGETFKVALLSTTEGEDKPLKYPTLFQKAAATILTKMDLVRYLDWDLMACRRNIQTVHPGMFTFELSARTGEGMQPWLDYITRLASARVTAETSCP